MSAFSSKARAAALAAALLFASGTAFAAARFSANPVRLSLPTKVVSTTITVENAGTQPVTVEAKIYQWSQGEAGDELTPASDLIVTPPLFKVAAQHSQTVRVGRLRPAAPSATERTYRVLFTEVPKAQEAKPGVHLNTVLQLSLPIFVPAAAPVDQTVSWSLKRQSDGSAELWGENTGNYRVQYARMAIKDGDKLIRQLQGSEYLLAGAKRRWKLPPGSLSSNLKSPALELLPAGEKNTVTQALQISTAQ